MKLRFYLRGLGIGILVTAMIFCILPDEKAVMSDEEVRARALQLGMVESDSLTLADIQNSGEPSEPVESESVESEEPSEPVESESVESEESSGPVESEPVESEEPSEPVESGSPESEESSEASESAESGSAEESGTITLTIESGYGSYAVSKVLAENALVEDAGEFDSYLCNNGYSKKIKAGTYEIPSGATWEELVKIICGK